MISMAAGNDCEMSPMKHLIHLCQWAFPFHSGSRIGHVPNEHTFNRIIKSPKDEREVFHSQKPFD
jgi:hypothetical protein